jgi:hypothetical protein
MNHKKLEECLKTQREINKNLKEIVENLREWTRRSHHNADAEENPSDSKNK